jgi:hypothetical protein
MQIINAIRTAFDAPLLVTESLIESGFVVDLNAVLHA